MLLDAGHDRTSLVVDTSRSGGVVVHWGSPATGELDEAQIRLEQVIAAAREAVDSRRYSWEDEDDE